MYETAEIIDKIVNSKLLNRKDRLVLFAHLATGSGPGYRIKKGTSHVGLDLEDFTTKIPIEWNEVQDQIKELESQDVTITVDNILFGANQSKTRDEIIIPRLIGVRDKPIAIENLKKALIKELDLDNKSYKEIENWFFSFRESFDSEQCDCEDKSPTEELRESIDKSKMLMVLDQFLSGKKVSIKDMISLVVAAVAANIEFKTLLSTEPIFNGSIKDIARAFLDIAKSKSKDSSNTIFGLVMAPVLDKSLRSFLKIK